MSVHQDQSVPTVSVPSSRGGLTVPEVIQEASGINVFGKCLKSFVFTTDVAIVRNINADAVIAMHPFTSQVTIIRSIISASDIPVFCGIGGGTLNADRMAHLAFESEVLGARGTILNAAVSDDVIAGVKSATNIPVILTVTSSKANIEGRIAAGVDIFNVSAAADTPNVVKYIKSIRPDFPVIATGGPTRETVLATIDAGANAISYTPPPVSEIFKIMIDKYRKLF